MSSLAPRGLSRNEKHNDVQGATCVSGRKGGAMRKPAWDYCASIYLPKRHCAILRDDQLGVQMQLEIKRDWTFFTPKEHEYFFIDGVKRVYRSQKKLMNALEHRIGTGA